MPASRRQVLTASALALLAGCLDDGTPTEDDDDETSTSDENGTDDNPSEGTPTEPQYNEYMSIEALIIEDLPSSIDPVPSDDERVDGVGLFADLFERLADEEYERGTVYTADYGQFESISTDDIRSDSDKGEATREAYESLSEHTAEGLPTSPYLEHQEEVLSIRLRVIQEE